MQLIDEILEYLQHHPMSSRQDVESQIREAVDDMCALINGKTDPYEKALLALLLISYIQPFEDGNKPQEIWRELSEIFLKVSREASGSAKGAKKGTMK